MTKTVVEDGAGPDGGLTLRLHRVAVETEVLRSQG